MFPQSNDYTANGPPTADYAGRAFASAAYAVPVQGAPPGSVQGAPAYGGATYGATSYPTPSYSAAYPAAYPTAYPAAYPGNAPRVRAHTPSRSGLMARVPPGPRPEARPEARPMYFDQGSSDLKTHIPLSKMVFICTGALVVFILLFLPVYESIGMLKNFNYVYWHGTILPLACIALCISCFFLWIGLASCVIGGDRSELVNKHDISLTAATMVTIIGVVLLFVSMTGTTQSLDVRLALSGSCDSNVQSRAVRAWYQSALTLRKTPACADKYTIEDCAGFSALSLNRAEYPYYKKLENTFQCSGFCSEEPVADKAGLLSIANASSADQIGVQQRKQLSLVPSFLSKHVRIFTNASSRAENLPPTLFSNLNFSKVSCQGAAAQNLYFAVVSNMNQMWWIGICLIASAVLIGFADQFSMLKQRPAVRYQ